MQSSPCSSRCAGNKVSWTKRKGMCAAHLTYLAIQNGYAQLYLVTQQERSDAEAVKASGSQKVAYIYLIF